MKYIAKALIASDSLQKQWKPGEVIEGLADNVAAILIAKGRIVPLDEPTDNRNENTADGAQDLGDSVDENMTFDDMDTYLQDSYVKSTEDVPDQVEDSIKEEQPTKKRRDIQRKSQDSD